MVLKYFVKNAQNGPGPVLGTAGFGPWVTGLKLTLWIGCKAFSDKRESIVATRWRWDGHYSRFSTKWSWFITDIKCCFRSHLTSWLWNRKWSFGIPFCWVNLYNEFSFMLWIWHKLNWQGLITFLKLSGQVESGRPWVKVDGSWGSNWPVLITESGRSSVKLGDTKDKKWTALGQSGRFMGVQLTGPNYWKWTVIC